MATNRELRNRFLAKFSSAGAEILSSSFAMQDRDAEISGRKAKGLPSGVPSGLTLPKYINEPLSFKSLTDKISQETLAKACVGFLKLLYLEDFRGEPDYELIISQYLTTLTLFCGSLAITRIGVPSEFEKYGYTLTTIHWTVEQVEDQWVRDWPLVCNLMGLQKYACAFHKCVEPVIAVASVSLLFLVKHSSRDYFTSWFDNRLREALQLLKSDYRAHNLRKPNLLTCNSISIFWSSVHPVRYRVFTCIRVVAVYDGGSYKYLFESLLKNMWWTEMAHIPLIHNYIIHQNPEILRGAEMLGFEKQRMIAACDILASLDEADRPFAKIILPPENTACLQSRHFTHLYEAAIVIAELTHSISIPRCLYDNKREGLGLTLMKQSVTRFILAKRANSKPREHNQFSSCSQYI